MIPIFLVTIKIMIPIYKPQYIYLLTDKTSFFKTRVYISNYRE